MSHLPGNGKNLPKMLKKYQFFFSSTSFWFVTISFFLQLLGTSWDFPKVSWLEEVGAIDSKKPHKNWFRQGKYFGNT